MIVASPTKATNLVRAMCVLHNYLRTVQDPNYVPTGFADTVEENGEIRKGFWRINPPGQLRGMERVGRRHCNEAAAVRDRLCTYFVSPEGSVEWQAAHVNQR